jgi:hypothetical protein
MSQIRKARLARLDANRDAQPLTEIRAHLVGAKLFGPGIAPDWWSIVDKDPHASKKEDP